MSDDTQQDAEDDPQTARTVGQMVKYSREVNQADTVDEVGTYALEATFHMMEGHAQPTVVDVRGGDLRVLESMSGHVTTGEGASTIARRAYDTGRTVIATDDAVRVDYAATDVETIENADEDTSVTIAASSVDGTDADETGVVLVARWSDLDTVKEHQIKPLEYLADHVSTAITNIRSRKRLERARNDLARRKEMVEVYDRLLRHDLGNDLQVITGFSEALATAVDEDDQAGDYARKIRRTAKSAADLVDRVGDLVRTLEQEEEPEPRSLHDTLAKVIEDVDTKFESLTVEFDAESVDGEVYAGDLLDSIFRNVLSNAAVHNDGPVTVRIHAEEPSPDRVVVCVADDGTGVPEAVRDEIFEMGKKGSDSDGTGFGLGLARALTESYGGGISVRDSDRGGAEFRVRLHRP